MRVDLLLILFLQTENDLYRDNTTIGTLDFHGGGNRNCKDLVKSQTKEEIALTLSSILINVGCHRLSVDNILQKV